MQTKNKKNFIRTITHTITHTAKRLVAWLHNRPDAVVNARPIHRDIHLNSSKAISIYLAMMDRPCKPCAIPSYIIESHDTYSDIIARIDETGGGTSLNELE